MSGIIEWEVLGLVVAVGLLVGGGVPALFALGLRLLAKPGAVRRAGGYLCLAVCVGAVLAGLAFLVSGGH